MTRIIACLLLTFFAHTLWAEVRTWTDATGKFSVEAELVEVVDGVALLKKADGRQIKVPLGKLSAADREFIAAAKPVDAGEPKLAIGRAAIAKLLREPATLDFKETPLEEVVTFLRQKHGLQILIDDRSLEDIGISPRKPVTAQVKMKPLGEALAAMIQAHELTLLVRDEVLWITAEEEAESSMNARVYQLLRRVEPDALLADLQAKVSPKSWAVVGGVGEARVLGPVLIVSARDSIHGEIEKKYAELLKPLPPPAPPKPKDKVTAALAEATALEFIETPLEDVADYLADLHKTPVTIDEAAINDVGIGVDTPMTLRVYGVSLRSGLSIMLGQWDLSWTFKDNGILITTPEKSESMLIETVYPVGDILRAVGGDADALSEAITALIYPTHWQTVGGPGKLAIDARGNMTVQQTPQVHWEIDPLLQTLRGGP